MGLVTVCVCVWMWAYVCVWVWRACAKKKSVKTGWISLFLFLGIWLFRKFTFVKKFYTILNKYMIQYNTIQRKKCNTRQWQHVSKPGPWGVWGSATKYHSATKRHHYHNTNQTVLRLNVIEFGLKWQLCCLCYCLVITFVSHFQLDGILGWMTKPDLIAIIIIALLTCLMFQCDKNR